jgi:hypothetical protein
MGKEIKYMDIKEFREKGYLQEVNRRFLHPLGLALEIIIDETGTEKLGGIWDYRDDGEGIYYDLKNSDEQRINKFKRNRNFIDSELKIIGDGRLKKLGFVIEPINEEFYVFKACTDFIENITKNITNKCDIENFVDSFDLNGNKLLHNDIDVLKHLNALAMNQTLNNSNSEQVDKYFALLKTINEIINERI